MSEILKVLNKIRTELKSETVELKNVATLDKLVEQSQAIIPELKKLAVWEKSYISTKADNKKRMDKVEPQIEKLQRTESELRHKAENAQSNLTKAQDEFQRARRNIEKDIEKKKAKDGKKNSNLRKLLEKNIADFQKAGKDLGVDVKIGKYQKMLDQLKNLPSA